MKTSDKILWSVKPPQDKEEIWGCIQGDNITLKRFHNGQWRTIGGGNSGGSSSDNNVLVVRPVEDYHEVGENGSVWEEAALVDTDFNTIVEAYKSGKVIIYSDTNLLSDETPANYLLGYAEAGEDELGEFEVLWLYFYSVPFNSGGGSQVSSTRLCILPINEGTYATRQDDGWNIGGDAEEPII